MSGNHIATSSDEPELHSFVKLAIAYLGIMAGFAVIGLAFYVIAARGEAVGSALQSAGNYANIGSYVLLFVLSLAGLALMVKRKRAGAYIAFATLVLSIFAPSLLVTGTSPYGVIWWFAIPNAVIGILLLRALKTLE